MRCSSFIDPRTQRGCLTPDAFYGLFPSWATKYDIEKSVGAMGWPVGEEPQPPTTSTPRPSHWPECNPVAMCSSDSFWNELACTCMNLYKCGAPCPDGLVQDPVNGCNCVSEKEYRSYFPDWAS